MAVEVHQRFMIGAIPLIPTFSRSGRQQAALIFLSALIAESRCCAVPEARRLSLPIKIKPASGGETTDRQANFKARSK